MKNLILSIFIVVGLVSMNVMAKDKKDRKPALEDANCAAPAKTAAIGYDLKEKAWFTRIICSNSNKSEARMHVRGPGYSDAVQIYDLAVKGKLKASIGEGEARFNRVYSLSVKE